jgi:two-component system chemotaxis response regulator CheB
MSGCKVAFIGASAGGVTALQNLFNLLRPQLNVAFVVVLHIGKSASIEYDLIYGDSFKGEIVEILDKMEIRPNCAYFAPADYHVLIERGQTFALNQGEPVHFARPSIDVTFSSGAEVFGSNCCGVLMTGGNQDGAAGLKDIFESGGLTLVQDPKTADFPIMPSSALELFKPQGVHDLKGLANRINLWAMGETV